MINDAAMTAIPASVRLLKSKNKPLLPMLQEAKKEYAVYLFLRQQARALEHRALFLESHGTLQAKERLK